MLYIESIKKKFSAKVRIIFYFAIIDNEYSVKITILNFKCDNNRDIIIEKT